MKSDTFFYKLVQQLPETLFVIQGLPEDGATDYGFAAAEVKKSYRLDGLLTPLKPGLPLYFVEFQFRRDAGIYANLFSKVFGYLNENDPKQNWVAVVIFGSRKLEPKSKYLAPYQPLLDSGLIRRFYLDEMVLAPDAHPCLKLLKLVCVPEKEAPPLVEQLIRHARQKPNSDRSRKLLGLVEEVLMRRFTQLDREEVRRMFKLHDIRESKIWQEAHKEGREEGWEVGREEGESLIKQVVQQKLRKGMSTKEVAAMLEISLAEVRRFAR